jgi:hypothetical protein
MDFTQVLELLFVAETLFMLLLPANTFEKMHYMLLLLFQFPVDICKLLVQNNFSLGSR